MKITLKYFPRKKKKRRNLHIFSFQINISFLGINNHPLNYWHVSTNIFRKQLHVFTRTFYQFFLKSYEKRVFHWKFSLLQVFLEHKRLFCHNFPGFDVLHISMDSVGIHMGEVVSILYTLMHRIIQEKRY